ncbi:MAG TPA: hypothetical protein PL117_06175 [Accumulibacter sp.]|uniref:DUF6920 family protein n=1 Tax=Accumulibacter sp. TaxID=2053492 RepID=UPI002CFAC3F1|nr:DUF6544 family protein [Accumulibacter sp.]HRD92844.1 hypothetical protein [Accumulibacter sp.]HRF72344.1 hypothetical protein [Accumulibacter sp.]
MEPLLTIVFVAVLTFVGISIVGAVRWAAATRALRTGLDAARQAVLPARFDARELVGLPDPVQRYFRLALTVGQPLLRALVVEHSGSFNIARSGDNWKPFTSGQRVCMRRPGFLWDARVTVAPGVTVHVHDAYVAGEGTLHPALLGLFPLGRVHGRGAIAEAELMRFLAEAACYPTALLPSQGVFWQAVDSHSAIATLADGEVTVSLLFGFNDAGLIESVRAEARACLLAGQLASLPWEGLWSAHEQHHGMWVPMRGEVRWLLPQGPKPYWRGCVGRLDYEFS